MCGLGLEPPGPLKRPLDRVSAGCFGSACAGRSQRNRQLWDAGPSPDRRSPEPLARCSVKPHASLPAMARLVGINHVALEVDDVDAALAWYGRFFEFELRGRAGARMAFVDMGDQFIAIAAGRSQAPDEARHFGLVVDDKEAVRAALRATAWKCGPPGSLDFRDPWGNCPGRRLPRHPVHQDAGGAAAAWV